MGTQADPAVRTRNRWGEGERLRVEILEAAGRLLSELNDSDGITIRGVARATGIAPASIYTQFADRAALLDGLLEHEIDRLCAVVSAAFAPPDDSAPDADPVEAVRAQLTAYCDYAVAHPGHYRILFRRRSDQPPDTPSPMTRILAEFQRSLEQVAAAGHALRLPGDRAAVVIFMAAHGRMALYHANPTERSAQKLPRFVDELVSLVLA